MSDYFVVTVGICWTVGYEQRPSVRWYGRLGWGYVRLYGGNSLDIFLLLPRQPLGSFNILDKTRVTYWLKIIY